MLSGLRFSSPKKNDTKKDDRNERYDGRPRNEVTNIVGDNESGGNVDVSDKNSFGDVGAENFRRFVKNRQSSLYTSNPSSIAPSAPSCLTSATKTGRHFVSVGLTDFSGSYMSAGLDSETNRKNNVDGDRIYDDYDKRVDASEKEVDISEASKFYNKTGTSKKSQKNLSTASFSVNDEGRHMRQLQLRRLQKRAIEDNTNLLELIREHMGEDVAMEDLLSLRVDGKTTNKNYQKSSSRVLPESSKSPLLSCRYKNDSRNIDSNSRRRCKTTSKKISDEMNLKNDKCDSDDIDKPKRNENRFDFLKIFKKGDSFGNKKNKSIISNNERNHKNRDHGEGAEIIENNEDEYKDFDMNKLSSLALKAQISGDEQKYDTIQRELLRRQRMPGNETVHEKELSITNANDEKSKKLNTLKKKSCEDELEIIDDCISCEVHLRESDIHKDKTGKYLYSCMVSDADNEYHHHPFGDGVHQQLKTVKKESTEVSRRRKKPATTDLAQRYYEDDDMTFQEVYKKMKIMGVENYDKNLASYILKKGSSFHQLHKDDDEIHDLERYESSCNHVKMRKRQIVQMRREQFQRRRLNQALSRCSYCLDTENFEKYREQSLISISPHVYLCLQTYKLNVLPYHLLIVPIEHSCAVTMIDSEVYEQIRAFQKTLVQFLDSKNLAPIFIETVTHMVPDEKIFMRGGVHTAIEVLPVPQEILQQSKAFFKKALNEVESEWSTHKKIIQVKGREGIRRAIPPGFPYIHVDFSLCGDSFAHVIEEGKKFPVTFGRDVIMGMLELDVTHRAYPTFEKYIDGVEKVRKEYKSFDPTNQ